MADAVRGGLAEGGGDGSTVVPARAGMAWGAVWLLAALLMTRQVAAVLDSPSGRRLIDLATWSGRQGILHVHGSLYTTTSFTGSPFSGLVLRPLTTVAEQRLGVAWTFGTLLLVVAVALIAARGVPGPLSHRTRLLVAPAAICLTMLSVPVRSTFTLGQVSVLPVLLVLLGYLTLGHRPRWGGLLIGFAAALQPAVLLFVPLLWLVGRRGSAATAAGTFAGCTLLAWAAMPQDSWTYWIHHLAGAGLGAPADSTANQSLHGALLRIGLHGPGELALLAVLSLAVAVLGLRRAARYALDGQHLLAVALTGCVAIAVSPAAWQYQQLWILLAIVGRVGRRTGDRLVWPVFVVLAMSLGADALVPNIHSVAFLGENAPLFAALLAACAVPFLTTTSPLWDEPITTNRLCRPNLPLELLLIRVGYWAYSWIRAQAPNGRGLAERHGRQVLRIEGDLHVAVEHPVNHWIAGVPWLSHVMDFDYETFHFLVPIMLLSWLYARRPADYRWARTALAFATLVALLGFWLYPLAPPRLMPGLGFVDTAHGPQNLAHPDYGVLTGISNQYAAMPSLHIGWSLWCALVVARVAPRVWMKALAACYPLFTLAVILGTANHYVLDALAGAVVTLLGFAVQRAWQRWVPMLLPSGARTAPAGPVRGEGPGDTAPEELPAPAGG